MFSRAGGGAASPTPAKRFSVVGATLKPDIVPPPLETTRVTVIDWGEFEAPFEVTAIVPGYVPGARPVGSTLMLKIPGVVVALAFSCSQVPPSLVERAAVKSTEGVLLVVTWTTGARTNPRRCGL